ncbi:hypothetical protein [Mycolicibacterium setense]
MISPSVAQSASLAGDLATVKMHYATVFGAIISLFLEWTEGNLGDDRAKFVDHVTAVLDSSPLSPVPTNQSPITTTEGVT